jgi:hypothetical protein
MNRCVPVGGELHCLPLSHHRKMWVLREDEDSCIIFYRWFPLLRDFILIFIEIWSMCLGIFCFIITIAERASEQNKRLPAILNEARLILALKTFHSLFVH